MKVVIVFNHPYVGSFCNAILNAVSAGLTKSKNEIDLIHLDNDKFDPVMRSKDLEAFAKARNDSSSAIQLVDPMVIDYKQRLENAEHLVFIFPIWWELMPAMTKGFIDKVIFPGITYEYAKMGMKSKMKKLKGLTVITTMNTPSFVYWILFGNAIKKAIMTGTFWKIGVKKRKWMSLNMVKFVSEDKRNRWLTTIEKKFSNLK